MLPIAVLSTLLVLFTAAPSTEALPTLASHSRRSRLSANNVRNQRAPADDTLVERHSSSFSAFLRTLRRAKADPIEQASFSSVAIDVPALLRFKKRDLVGVVNPKSRRQIGETETHLSADEEVYDEGAIPSREVARRRYLALHENDKRDLADDIAHGDIPASVTVTLVPTIVVETVTPSPTPTTHIAFVAAQPVVAGSHTLSGNFVPVTLAQGSPAAPEPSSAAEPNEVHGVIIVSPEEVAASADTTVTQSIHPESFANDGPSAMFTSTFTDDHPAVSPTAQVTETADWAYATPTADAEPAEQTGGIELVERADFSEDGEGTEWVWEECTVGVDEGCEPYPAGETPTDLPTATATATFA